MVCPELLRGDMEDTASRLTSCYNSVWETKRWPKLWKRKLLRYSRKVVCTNTTTEEESVYYLSLERYSVGCGWR